ncbi:MAG: ATP-binding protein [Acidobacteria bacterium]|nr:ATP-binding protein [Acidobacteriota bacterium]MYK88826.1 ATP-binding protein [Acidobacteriota bacterium]
MGSYRRELVLDLPERQSAFLWGPRKTGKSTLLAERFPGSARFDLLETRTALDFTREPWLFTERVLALDASRRGRPIVVDEVQKVPALLDEVHRLIEQHGLAFVLCGSSARKLKRGGANLLGGRAWRFGLHPLAWPEVPELDLLRALNRGLVPQHYDAAHHRRALAGYVDDYLKEEVFAEGLTRNTSAFARFFDALGFCHGQVLNFSNVARDCGVDAKTVREYFQILVDTLLGEFLEPFSRRRSRAVLVRAPKFYLFDVGVAGHLSGRRLDRAAGPAFGQALEHYVLMELLAFRSYRELDVPIRYWRTKSGLEVDFVLGREAEVAIEVKGTSRVRPEDMKGIRAFREEHGPRQAIVVSNDTAPRRSGDIDVLPWRVFLDRLWGNELI